MPSIRRTLALSIAPLVLAVCGVIYSTSSIPSEMAPQPVVAATAKSGAQVARALPSLFISHGSPMMAVQPGNSGKTFRRLAKELPKPKAIVVMSAHWESTRDVLVLGNSQPETLHDFYGFPDSLYKVLYPAPGEPTLAERVVGMLRKRGIRAAIDPSRPRDHGCWVPLVHMYPKHDIPVIQISLPRAGGPAAALAVGDALKELRQEGVLLIGSGSITHNLGRLDRARFMDESATPRPTRGYEWAGEFRDWVADRLDHGDLSSLQDWEHKAPHALISHPRDEHFLPLFFAIAAGGNKFKVEQSDFMAGSLGMDIYSFS